MCSQQQDHLGRGFLQLMRRSVGAAMHRSTIASCRAGDNAEDLFRTQPWLTGLQRHGTTQASWWLYCTQYKQVEWETPAGELVRRPPPLTNSQGGAGRCRHSHAFHWQARAFTGPCSYENILVGQREHAAAVRRIELWPRAKLGSRFELWKRSRLPSGTEAAQDLLPSRRRCLMCPSPFDTSYPPPPTSSLRGNVVLPYRRHRWPCSSWLGGRKTAG